MSPIFDNYIHPLMNWLEIHPISALFFTFLIAFAESLVIIGSIIPGSVTMTAIGILAGSGIMRIDLTYAFSTLGAICGDSLSYTLGFHYRDKLSTIYPFSRYPQLITFGKDYFKKHGGKSVLLGRFIGPLRSIIPVIAGIVHMNKLQFFIANMLSGIAWSFLYVTPGVLIGLASNELSTESATKFMLLVFGLLVIVWLATLFVKFFLLQLHRFLSINMTYFWKWSLKHPRLSHLFLYFTPKNETDFFRTGYLLMAIFLLIISFVYLIIDVTNQMTLAQLNEPLFYFLQSIKTHFFDSFMIFMTAYVKSSFIVITAMLILLFILSQQQWRLAIYFTTVLLMSFLCALGLSHLLGITRPQGLTFVHLSPSFPSVNLTILASLCFMLGLLIKNSALNSTIKLFRYFLTLLPFIIGCSLVFLGDHWFTDILGSYLLSLLIVLIHWLFLRRKWDTPINNGYPFIILFCLYVIIPSWYYHQNYQRLRYEHEPILITKSISYHQWWYPSNTSLPIYRINRIGRKVNVFNIQYVGSVNAFQMMLRINGWSIHRETFLNAFLNRINGEPASTNPLLIPLYQNKRPILVMKYTPIDGTPTLVLRLWRSHYIIKESHLPIWIGSIQIDNPKMTHIKPFIDSVAYIHLDTTLFRFNYFTIPKNKQKLSIPQIQYKIIRIRHQALPFHDIALNT